MKTARNRIADVREARPSSIQTVLLILLLGLSNAFMSLANAQQSAPPAIVQNFPVNANPLGLAFDGTNVWVTSSGEPKMTVLRASDGARVGQRERRLAQQAADALEAHAGDLVVRRAAEELAEAPFQYAPRQRHLLSFEPWLAR